MSQAYTPALEISTRRKISKIRELPLKGKALVQVGDAVTSQTAVLSAELPGELDIIRVADRLGFDPEQVLDGMKVKTGDSVQAGDILCEVKSFFGMFSSSVKAPSSGVVEFFTDVNAHLGIRRPSSPFEVQAYLNGTVTQIDEGKAVTIESEGAIIQGIFGVGGERYGEIFVLEVAPDARVEAGDLPSGKLAGKVVIGGGSYSIAALKKAAEEKVSAVVTGSVDSQTLRELVGYEIGVSITGDEEVAFTFIITEGFGSLPLSPRVVTLAKKLAGLPASVNGATQVRAGAMRPEIIVAPFAAGAGEAIDDADSRVLIPGSRVRLIRVPFFGRFGTVTDLPHSPQGVESGAVVRVAHVKLEDGEEVLVPRANIELA